MLSGPSPGGDTTGHQAPLIPSLDKPTILSLSHQINKTTVIVIITPLTNQLSHTPTVNPYP